MQHIEYGGWPNCFRLHNSQIELILTADVGPRIIHCALPGGSNLFYEAPDQRGQRGGGDYRLYGGHRLWHAPEHMPRSYQPDNDPLNVVELGERAARFSQPVEKLTGIRKELEVRLDADVPRATLLHRLCNDGPWPLTLAAWSISMMAPGGVGLLPLQDRGAQPPRLPAGSSISLWDYTDLSDPRLSFGRRLILVRQDPKAPAATKLGTSPDAGWLAYVLGETLFLTTYTPQPAAHYPDRGAGAEIYTNADLLEIETLSPFEALEPGQSIEHRIEWQIHPGFRQPASLAEAEAELLPRIEALLKH